MCHLSHVTCHLSHVTWHMPTVTCYFFLNFFFQKKKSKKSLKNGPSGGASWLRVFYQRGLPRLVQQKKVNQNSLYSQNWISWHVWSITSIFVFFFFVPVFFFYIAPAFFCAISFFLHCHWHHHRLWCWHCQRPHSYHWCLDRQPFNLRAPAELICLALQLFSRLRWRPKILPIYTIKNNKNARALIFGMMALSIQQISLSGVSFDWFTSILVLWFIFF